MISLHIILEEVPNYLLEDLKADIEDVQDSYYLTADASINVEKGYVCLDLENHCMSVAVALQNSIEMLDDMGLSVFMVEMGVLK